MITIKAILRKDQGKGASRRLRHTNKFPAIIYGGKKEPVIIEINHDDVINYQYNDDFYNSTITLEIDDKSENVKVQAIQRHPFKPKVTHIDFLRV